MDQEGNKKILLEVFYIEKHLHHETCSIGPEAQHIHLPQFPHLENEGMGFVSSKVISTI